MFKRLKMTAGSNDEQIRLLFAFIGLTSGLVGYCYFEYIKDLLGARYAWSMIIVPPFFLATFANFFFMSYDRRYDKQSLAFSLGLSTVLSLLLFWHVHGMAQTNNVEKEFFPPFLLFWIISQIALPLGISWIEQGKRHPSYEILHRKAWNLPLLSLSAAFLVGLMWGVLWLCAFTLAIVGIKLQDLLTEPWFYIPFTSAIYGLGVAIAREKEHTIAMMRDLKLNLIRITLPLLTVITVVTTFIFTLVMLSLIIPNAGNLDKEVTYSYMSLITSVIAITAVNAVIAYDNASESKARINTLSVKTIVIAMTLSILLPLTYLLSALIAYGFTPERLYGLIATILLGVYIYAYGASFVLNSKDTPAWFEAMRRQNIWIAYIVLAVALWLTSPLGNLNAIATAQQLNSLKSGKVSVENFDVRALYYKFGKSGKAALTALSEDTNFAQAAALKAKIKEVEKSGRYGRNTTPTETLPYNVTILPKKHVLPEALKDHYSLNPCRTAENQCVLVRIPGRARTNGDQYVLIRKNMPSVNILYQTQDGKWQDRYQNVKRRDLYEKAAHYRVEERRYDVIVIDGLAIDPLNRL